MRTVAENRTFWGEVYDWHRAGDEWSVAWGSAKMQWSSCLLPRIRACLPAKTVLEIGAGHGRWTQFLHPLCERLVVVDLSEPCIAACRKRYAHVTNIEYHVNDGRSLEFVPDRTLDFVFSFDSLVHADEETIAAYLQGIARKLRKDGAAFLHHSNVGGYPKLQKLVEICPRRIKSVLGHFGLSHHFDLHNRDTRMSAPKFESLAKAAGLGIISQELIS